METSQTLNAGLVDNSRSPHCRIRSTSLDAVHWNADGFWGRRFQQCVSTTIPHLWNRLNGADTGHVIQNLRIYAGLEQGEFWGTAWHDEWLYKWIEAASIAFQITGSAELDQQLDEAIAVIAQAQEEDGYIASQILRFKERWLRPGNHELYVMGHLISAACVHYRATGKDTLLNVAIKTADFLYRTFMPRSPELAHFCVNPSYIMALVDLYRLTQNKSYLDLAGTFIDMRGSQPGGTDLNQTRVPFRQETEVVGHSVFWTYLFAGVADVFMETGEEALIRKLEEMWQDVVQHKIYIHGGVASYHHAISRQKDPVHEAIGVPYDLPNASAYNETCAQIGNFMWNWRMFLINGETRHLDVMEQTLYNSIISSLGEDGACWFYTNPLRWHGESHTLLSQDSHQRFQPGTQERRWHLCCPSNLLRTVTEFHTYLYSRSESQLFFNFYNSSTYEEQWGDAGTMKIVQTTDYPWDGTVSIRIEQAPDMPLTLQLRIPSWARQATIQINGKPWNGATVAATFASVTSPHKSGQWQAGDEIILQMPMQARLVQGNPRIEQATNQAAVLRGPIVYCLESKDLPEHVRMDQIFLPVNAQFAPVKLQEFNGGAIGLEGTVLHEFSEAWDGILYRDLESTPLRPLRIRLIPYHLWANRGISEMTVFMPLARTQL